MIDITVAIGAIAALTAASAIVVIVRMYETHPRHDRTPVLADVDPRQTSCSTVCAHA